MRSILDELDTNQNGLVELDEYLQVNMTMEAYFFLEKINVYRLFSAYVGRQVRSGFALQIRTNHRRENCRRTKRRRRLNTALSAWYLFRLLDFPIQVETRLLDVSFLSY